MSLIDINDPETLKKVLVNKGILTERDMMNAADEIEAEERKEANLEEWRRTQMESHIGKAVMKLLDINI